MNNVELVKQGYQNFAEGKVEEVLATFHPEIVWDECTGFPYVSGDGISIGPNAVIRDATIGHGCHIEQAVVEKVAIDDQTVVEPFSYLRG